MERATLTTACLSANLSTTPLGNKQKHTKDTLK